jgi:predicted metal-dependent hydrolase
MIAVDRLVRSHRKTVALVIELDGSLTVRAPLRLGRAQIEQLVQEKAAWIQERRERLQHIRSQVPTYAYQPGELFLYLGAAYPLEIVERLAPRLALEEGVFRLARRAQPQAEQVFTEWYRRQARREFAERVAQRARQLGYTYQRVRISSARTRWGSCGAKGGLNFTWRLVMAPAVVIDYVIVHELVHLEFPNHSRQFWERVAHHLPDYRQQREWLRLNGHRLAL